MKTLTQNQEQLLFKELKFIDSPRSYNYITRPFKNGVIIINKPKLTVHQEALLDYCFHLLRQSLLESIKRLPIITGKEIMRVSKHPDKFSKDLGSTEFKTKNFRKATGLRRKDEQIIEDINILKRSPIQCQMVKVFYEENGYEVIDWEGSIFTDRVIRKTGKIAPRTKKPQHSILVVWGLLTGLVFYNDIKHNRICLFPKEFYSKLPHPAQRILRFLSLRNHKKLTLKEILDLLSWKIGKNPSKWATVIEVYFDELKHMGFITNWKRVKNTKGLETTWEFFGIKTTKQLNIDKKGE